MMVFLAGIIFFSPVNAADESLSPTANKIKALNNKIVELNVKLNQAKTERDREIIREERKLLLQDFYRAIEAAAIEDVPPGRPKGVKASIDTTEAEIIRLEKSLQEVNADLKNENLSKEDREALLKIAKELKQSIDSFRNRPVPFDERLTSEELGLGRELRLGLVPSLKKAEDERLAAIELKNNPAQALKPASVDILQAQGDKAADKMEDFLRFKIVPGKEVTEVLYIKPTEKGDLMFAITVNTKDGPVVRYATESVLKKYYQDTLKTFSDSETKTETFLAMLSAVADAKVTIARRAEVARAQEAAVALGKMISPPNSPGQKRTVMAVLTAEGNLLIDRYGNPVFEYRRGDPETGWKTEWKPLEQLDIQNIRLGKSGYVPNTDMAWGVEKFNVNPKDLPLGSFTDLNNKMDALDQAYIATTVAQKDAAAQYVALTDTQRRGSAQRQINAMEMALPKQSAEFKLKVETKKPVVKPVRPRK